jgi:hypothetical protein
MDEHRKPSPYLRSAEAAEYLRITENALIKWRKSGKGPIYHQPSGPGTRPVYYRIEDLEAWVEGGAEVGALESETIEAVQ